MSLAVIFVALPPAGLPKSAARPFAKVDNREVFMRCIEIYANRDQVTQRILVVHPDDLTTIQQKYAAHLGFQGVSVTSAGPAGTAPDWFAAVARALEKLEPHITTVLIHDASRPAVPYPLIDALEAEIEKSAAAVPVINLIAILATVNNNILGPSLDTAQLMDIQSPQIFRLAALKEAHAKRPALTEKLQGIADDATLAQLAGIGVTTIPGSRYNQRIDSDESLKLAPDLLKHLPRPKSKATLNPFGEAEW